MTYTEALELVVKGIETLGVAILVIGATVSVGSYAVDLRRVHRRRAYERLRANLGRTILLGLEVLIVADIVLTVAIDLTVESAVTLGLIVLVRTFLSFSLEVELDGVVPWHRRASAAEDEAVVGDGQPGRLRRRASVGGVRGSAATLYDGPSPIGR